MKLPEAAQPWSSCAWRCMQGLAGDREAVEHFLGQGGGVLVASIIPTTGRACLLNARTATWSIGSLAIARPQC